LTESQLNENNFFGFSYKNKNKDVDTKKLMAMDEKEAFQIARKWMEKNNLDPNEIQSMKQLDQYEIEKYDEITESQLGEETLNEVGMNMPWITKEPESWGGKPDKESKWFVHGDLETAKSKEETPAEFIAFEDNRPEYKSVFVGTNMPAENSKNSIIRSIEHVLEIYKKNNSDLNRTHNELEQMYSDKMQNNFNQFMKYLKEPINHDKLIEFILYGNGN
jgi:hypothetical protein